MDRIPEKQAEVALSLPGATFRRLSDLAAAAGMDPVDLVVRLIDGAWAARVTAGVGGNAEPAAPAAVPVRGEASPGPTVPASSPPLAGLPTLAGGSSGGAITPGPMALPLSPVPKPLPSAPSTPVSPPPWPPLPADIPGLEAEVRHLDLLIQTASESDKARLGDRYAEVTARLEGLRKG